jgi:DNA repair protein SbcD/Mre11
MRVLHTSDWHLGHSLHGVARDREHAAFLGWLAGQVEREACDALLITGDVFDGSNPPADAERQWFGFLAEVRARRPGVEVVVIAGNHDSPSRLSAATPVLAAHGVHVVTGAADAEAAVVELPGAVIAAVPFLRPLDLPRAADPMDAVRDVYRSVLDAARARRRGRALLATGHLFVSGCSPSYVSERRIVTGGSEAVPLDLFPDDLSYVALGHLHRAQRVGGREHVRYAGSPIPLAMGEADYRHQVLIADIVADAPAIVRVVEVPRTVDIVRVPRTGAAPIDDVLRALAELPAEQDGTDDARPYLEVTVALDKPEPRLRAQIEEALVGKRPRLVKITAVHTGSGRALADAIAGLALADLDPREVFARRWQRDHTGEPPEALRAAFDALVDEVRAEGAA